MPFGVAQDPALAEAFIHFDTGTYGDVELIHAYYTYWPTVNLDYFPFVTECPELTAHCDYRVSAWPAMALSSRLSPVGMKRLH